MDIFWQGLGLGIGLACLGGGLGFAAIIWAMSKI